MDSTDSRLSIMVEEKLDIHSWRADFTSKYVEEICAKSRAPLDFGSFLQTFDEALKHKQAGGKDVFIDLLAPSDLELLRGGGSQQKSQISEQANL